MFEQIKRTLGRQGTATPYSHPMKGLAVAAGTAAGFLLWLALVAAIIHWIA